MSNIVIPEQVIQGWKDQYAKNSELFTQYGLSEAEQDKFLFLVAKDKHITHDIAFTDAIVPTDRAPIYLATAGAPLAGKSTEMDKAVMDSAGLYANTVKIDPDVWTMKAMAHSYQTYLMSQGKISECDTFAEAQVKAYDLCRPASNYYSLECMNEAVAGGYDIAHGTTMTSPHVGGLMGNLKQNGYDIHLILVAAPDDMRAEASQYRQQTQGNYQSTPEDVRSKGEAFHERMPTYFDNADKLVLKWRDAVTDDAKTAAIYENGQKTVVDDAAYNNFVSFYQGDFAECEQAYVQRFQPK